MQAGQHEHRRGAVGEKCLLITPSPSSFLLFAAAYQGAVTDVKRSREQENTQKKDREREKEKQREPEQG